MVKVTATNNFQYKYPEQAKRWNKTLNHGITTDMITYGCKYIYDAHGNKFIPFWDCPVCGGTYDMYPYLVGGMNRGCPYCAGNRVLIGFNDLKSQHPEIARQWHQPGNGDITPEMVTCGAAKITVNGEKANPEWKCDKCGMTWRASINSRTRKKSAGCPYCSGRFAIPGVNDLATMNPMLASQWHQEGNGDIKPSMVKQCTGKIKVDGNSVYPEWECPVCHGCWRCRIGNRTNGTGCPYCAGIKVLAGYNDLAAKHPELVPEWLQRRNGNITPPMVTCGQGTILVDGVKIMPWWKCLKCGYEYQQSVNNRTNGVGCPCCANKVIVPGVNDLATTHPKVAAQWHQEGNGSITQEMVSYGAETILVDGERIEPEWECPNGHLYRMEVYRRTSNFEGCRVCSRELHHSNQEDDCADMIESVLRSYGINAVIERSVPLRDIGGSSRRELDVYIPELRLAFEYNGAYWHSDECLMRKYNMTADEYHAFKMNACRKLEITLVFIWDDDWINRRDSIVSLVRFLIDNRLCS